MVARELREGKNAASIRASLELHLKEAPPVLDEAVPIPIASIRAMSFSAAMGHACGLNFKAADHLKKHPEFRWEQSVLRDLNAGGWTTFRAE